MESSFEGPSFVPGSAVNPTNAAMKYPSFKVVRIESFIHVSAKSVKKVVKKRHKLSLIAVLIAV